MDESALLMDAKAKAQKLLDALIEQSLDLDKPGCHIAPDKIAKGQQVFAQAIQSAKSTIAEIDRALQSTAQRPH